MYRKYVPLVVCIAVLALMFTAFAGPTKGKAGGEKDEPAFHPSRVLVKPKNPQSLHGLGRLHAANGAKVLAMFGGIGNLQVVQIPKGKVKQFVAKYKNSGLVEYAEPDYIVHADVIPNDPRFGDLWGLHNTGQNGGTTDDDIDAPEAWDVIHDAPDVVVAVIDTGVSYMHEDLAANIWINTAEDLNANGTFESWPSTENRNGVNGDLDGTDADSNGVVDDVCGVNTIDEYGTPWEPKDDAGHGTHVSGTIGAVGNNGIGVTGVAWDVQIMACKFLDYGGSGYISDAIECVDYARMMGADIMSNSWGGVGYSQGLKDAIDSAANAGIVFVAAAGNNACDTDLIPHYPSCYNCENIVSVAATDNNDQLADFSCYGADTVDITAPGVDIVSTYYDIDTQQLCYGIGSGTSMATPHVAGALALLKQQHPNETWVQLIPRLYASADQITGLQGKCRTGARLNLYSLVTYLPSDLYVTPATDAKFGGMAGGPFSPSSVSYRLINYGTASMNYRVSTTQAWVTPELQQGTLAPNGSVVVSVSVDADGQSLSEGTYTDTVSFVNLRNGSGDTTRPVTLKIGKVYVDAATGSDSDNGSSWALAKQTVQAGIDTALPGQEVWVADGTYLENIILKPGVKLYGGFAGNEVLRSSRNWSTNETILDGQWQASTVRVAAACTSSTVIDGFTIRSGRANVHINYVGTGGGGIACWASPTISHNRIMGNNAVHRGGGIFCGPNSAPVIHNNLIAGNGTTWCSGGGIGCYGSAPIITNNTIVANKAGYGAGMALEYGTAGTMANNIVAFNSSGIHDDYFASVNYRNNDVYGNDEYQYYLYDDPEPTGTNGNISVDPRLADPKCGNLRIQPDSPCRDTGSDTYASYSDEDVDKQSRVQGLHIDIGADECDGTQQSVGPYIIIRVKPDGSDANDGSSWTLAKQTVQAALNALYVKGITAQGGEVWVKAGTYNERITLRPFAKLYGGFAGTETSVSQRDWKTNVTILDGQQAGSVVTTGGGHMLNRLDGFTIRNGYAIQGAGIMSEYGSSVITHNIITGNSTWNAGGGIRCESSDVITDNLIVGNTATSGGGGIYADGWPIITNNTVVDNTGDGIVADFSGGVIANNIVAFNSFGIWTLFGEPAVRNNCSYGNTDGDYDPVPTPGDGNISQDPGFVDRANGNYHLLGCSPCVDTGSNQDVRSDKDLDGNPRIYNGIVDLGTYEFQYKTIAQDDFGRSLSPGWGTADLGGNWTLKRFSDGGTWSEVSTFVTNVGFLEFYGDAVPGVCLLGSSASGSVDVSGKVWFCETASGAGVCAMASSYNTFYALTWYHETNDMKLEKYQNGSVTVLAQTTGPSSGSEQMMRLSVVCNQVKAKFWNVGSTEPTSWNLQATDSSPLTSGQMGFWVNSPFPNGWQFDSFLARESVK